MTNAEADNQRLQLKIDEYGDMLFKLSYIHLRNTQDAEDVTQEVFYQYLKHEGEFESGEHEKAWLLKVTMNACRKVCRSAWQRYRSDEDWTKAADTAALAENRVMEPEAAAFEQEKKRKLLAAVMALPARYRDVIHLFYYEELSTKEIARVTGRGESTVTSQLTRGRELLKKSLREEYDFG